MLFYRNGGSTKKLELKFVMDYGIRSVTMSCFTPPPPAKGGGKKTNWLASGLKKNWKIIIHFIYSHMPGFVTMAFDSELLSTLLNFWKVWKCVNSWNVTCSLLTCRVS